VNEFLDVFSDELPGMPLDRDIEFITELLLSTAPWEHIEWGLMN